ncbi:MAG: AMP-binding protein, partial [SAR324 cluster bacterium]|nr:AMP-binding protein [SAR324 cluster bacterium]
MKEHTFHLDTSSSPGKFEFSETFNVVVPFIDRHLTEDRGEKIAILCSNGESVRYSELADRINRCGNLLLGKGMKAEERLLMVVKDAPEFFYLFWGSIKAGIIPVPLNTLLRSQDFAFLIEDSECSGLVYSEEFSVEVEGALDSIQLKPDLVLKSESANKGVQQLVMDASPDLEPAPSQSDSDCFWLYSSGTTGRPIGAIHLHRDMMVTSQYYGVETLGISEADV